MSSRQQRRAEEHEARKRAVRQAWTASMLEVHHAAGGAFSNFLLVGVEQIEHVARAAIAGDPVGDALTEAVFAWLQAASDPDPDLPPLCLACQTQFGPGHAMPRGFAIALSFNHASAIGTGICRDCCERDRDELAHVLFDLQKRMFPDAQVMSGECGHA